MPAHAPVLGRPTPLPVRVALVMAGCSSSRDRTDGERRPCARSGQVECSSLCSLYALATSPPLSDAPAQRGRAGDSPLTVYAVSAGRSRGAAPAFRGASKEGGSAREEVPSRARALPPPPLPALHERSRLPLLSRFLPRPPHPPRRARERRIMRARSPDPYKKPRTPEPLTSKNHQKPYAHARPAPPPPWPAAPPPARPPPSSRSAPTPCPRGTRWSPSRPSEVRKRDRNGKRREQQRRTDLSSPSNLLLSPSPLPPHTPPHALPLSHISKACPSQTS